MNNNTENLADNPSPKYRHSKFFWPFWSSIAINVILSVFRMIRISSDINNPIYLAFGDETLIDIFFLFIVNTPIMLIIGVPLVALYRKRNAPPKWEWVIGIFIPILGLCLCGTLISFL